MRYSAARGDCLGLPRGRDEPRARRHSWARCATYRDPDSSMPFADSERVVHGQAGLLRGKGLSKILGRVRASEELYRTATADATTRSLCGELVLAPRES